MLLNLVAGVILQLLPSIPDANPAQYDNVGHIYSCCVVDALVTCW